MLCDLHTHSCYSFDANVPVDEMCRAAIAAGLTDYAITDHCDVDYEVNHWRPNLDRDAVWEEMTAAKEKYKGQINILRGVELGNITHYPDFADKVLDAHPYDFVIGSVHNLRGMPDCSSFNYQEIPEKQREFLFNQCLDENIGIVKYGRISTLGHITYMYRYIKLARLEMDFAPFRDKLCTLFGLLIEKDIPMEVNVSTMWRGLGFSMPHRELLELYRSCGGKLLTVGTDSHSTEHVGECVKEGFALIKSCGFDSVCVWRDGKRVLEKI